MILKPWAFVAVFFACPLGPLGVAIADEPESAEEAWEALFQKYEEQSAVLNEALAKAQTSENRAHAYKLHWPGQSFGNDLLEYERRWRGTDHGLAALNWIADLASGIVDLDQPIVIAKEKSAPILIRHYASHPHLDIII